jgi:hypothetical protein
MMEGSLCNADLKSIGFCGVFNSNRLRVSRPNNHEGNNGPLWHDEHRLKVGTGSAIFQQCEFNLSCFKDEAVSPSLNRLVQDRAINASAKLRVPRGCIRSMCWYGDRNKVTILNQT